MEHILPPIERTPLRPIEDLQAFVAVVDKGGKTQLFIEFLAARLKTERL